VTRIFKLEGVTNCFLGRDFITIGKEATNDWMALKPQIFVLLMDAFGEDGFVVMNEGTETVSDTTIHDDDDEIVAMIKELLETRIRPSVQEVSPPTPPNPFYLSD